jgi:hypothetical protein
MARLSISRCLGQYSTSPSLSYWINSIHKLGPLHTQDWEPVTITLQALSLVEKVEPVQVRFTIRLRDRQSMWMQDGCTFYVDFYIASNGSWFMVTWTIFKIHLLEICLTQNRETITLRTLTTVDLIIFYHVREPAWIGIHWKGIRLRARSHMISHFNWGSVTTLHGFGGDSGQPLDTFFWALTISWSHVLAHVWSGP